MGYWNRRRSSPPSTEVSRDQVKLNKLLEMSYHTERNWPHPDFQKFIEKYNFFSSDLLDKHLFNYVSAICPGCSKSQFDDLFNRRFNNHLPSIRVGDSCIESPVDIPTTLMLENPKHCNYRSITEYKLRDKKDSNTERKYYKYKNNKNKNYYNENDQVFTNDDSNKDDMKGKINKNWIPKPKTYDSKILYFFVNDEKNSSLFSIITSSKLSTKLLNISEPLPVNENIIFSVAITLVSFEYQLILNFQRILKTKKRISTKLQKIRAINLEMIKIDVLNRNAEEFKHFFHFSDNLSQLASGLNYNISRLSALGTSVTTLTNQQNDYFQKRINIFCAMSYLLQALSLYAFLVLPEQNSDLVEFSIVVGMIWPVTIPVVYFFTSTGNIMKSVLLGIIVSFEICFLFALLLYSIEKMNSFYAIISNLDTDDFKALGAEIDLFIGNQNLTRRFTRSLFECLGEKVDDFSEFCRNSL